MGEPPEVGFFFFFFFVEQFAKHLSVLVRYPRVEIVTVDQKPPPASRVFGLPQRSMPNLFVKGCWESVGECRWQAGGFCCGN